MTNPLADGDRIIRRSAAQARGEEVTDTAKRRLQALPLGRPPRFRDPVTIPPFTAERKLAAAIEHLMVHHNTTKSEILRRAVTRGLKQMLAEMKGEG